MSAYEKRKRASAFSEDENSGQLAKKRQVLKLGKRDHSSLPFVINEDGANVQSETTKFQERYARANPEAQRGA